MPKHLSLRGHCRFKPETQGTTSEPGPSAMNSPVFLNLQSLVSNLQSCQIRLYPHGLPPAASPHGAGVIASFILQKHVALGNPGPSGHGRGLQHRQVGRWQPGQVSCEAGKGRCWDPPIPTQMDLVTGVHSLLANSLMSLCWLTVCTGSCLVHPEALPASLMKDSCFTLV